MLNADNERQREALATVALACDNNGRCWDCGRSYGDEHGFPDLVVPDDVWARISPTGNEGGLLCPSCICRRAFDAGIEDVEAHFTSGPFAELNWRRPPRAETCTACWQPVAEHGAGGRVCSGLLREYPGTVSPLIHLPHASGESNGD